MQATDSPAIDGWQRCFIALAPDAGTRDALSTIQVSANARRVPYEQLHLTVTFIGALTVEQSGALDEQNVRARVLEHTGIRAHEVRLLAPGTLPRTSSGKLRRGEALRQLLAGELRPPEKVTLLHLAKEAARSMLAKARG